MTTTLTSPDTPASSPETLEQAVKRAANAILADQQEDGHWCYELEADCTIPAEYIILNHFMDEINEPLEKKIAVYLRENQAEYGGWPLFEGGDFDMSCSVKSYYALKMAGDDINAPHMIKAREAILERGGAAKSNVFTRITMALFGQVPWRAVPFIPVEAVLLPRWFFFHTSKVSYWSRTVMIPLFILVSLKAEAKNPKNISIGELFVTPPDLEEHYFEIEDWQGKTFFFFDRIFRKLEFLIPDFIRRHAINVAVKWFTERLNGDDGLGGIFPAMVNAYEAYAILGYDKEHPNRTICREAIDKLLVDNGDSAYCQPCLSPVWDTAIICHALREAGGHDEPIEKAYEWLIDCQLSDEPGDWRENHPHLEGGGWAFQYQNPHYPDLDDTAMIGWTMELSDGEKYRETIDRAAYWIDGMASKDGGYAAFDSDNTHYYLNHIPFDDHGALLDPPTADLTARCLAILAGAKNPDFDDRVEGTIQWLKDNQEDNGSWFGRWGTNYIYGTWSVLTALEVAGEDMSQAYIQRAVSWLKQKQHLDGGWGESNSTYWEDRKQEPHHSTSFQTAWAIHGLMAAGEKDTDQVKQGVEYLLSHQDEDGLWSDSAFTAPGFPRVFYLRYHGYKKFFPLWALARYKNETA